MPYTCAICGETHDDLPHVGFPAPCHWSEEFVGAPDSLLTADLCIIRGSDYFVRGVIEIPVHDYEHEFGFGVWVSHKKENFERYRERFDDAEDIGPFFGWLSTVIPCYRRSTLNLKTMAHYLGDGTRPRIMLDESKHLLSRQQREGISLAEAWKIVHRCVKDITESGERREQR